MRLHWISQALFAAMCAAYETPAPVVPAPTPNPTFTKDVTGGIIYVYDLAGDTIDEIDVHQLAVKAGCIPHRRPHMVRPNRSTAFHQRVLVPYFDALSGVLVMDAATRDVVACFDVEEYGPGLVHDAIWSPNDDLILLVDLKGYLHQYTADIVTDTYAYVGSYDLNRHKAELGTAIVKPISIEITSTRLVYATMSKGGALVLKLGNTPGEPLKHLHTYSATEIGGTGGVWALEQPDGKVVLEYGTQNPDMPDYIHRFDHNAALAGDFDAVESLEIPGVDLHGIVTCTKDDGSNVMILSNRLSMDLVWVDPVDYEVIKTDTITTEELHTVATDYIWYHDGYLYIAFRGPKPLSALKKQNPEWCSGTAIYKLDNCMDLSFVRFMSAAENNRNVENGGVTDVHGLAVITPEGQLPVLWSIDQAATEYYKPQPGSAFNGWEDFASYVSKRKNKSECRKASGKWRKRSGKCVAMPAEVICRDLKDEEVCVRAGCTAKLKKRTGKIRCRGQAVHIQ